MPSVCHDTATTVIYTLSLHDALPICKLERRLRLASGLVIACFVVGHFLNHSLGVVSIDAMDRLRTVLAARSEEHTSELQSRRELVCRLLPEKKNKVQHLWRSLRESCT